MLRSRDGSEKLRRIHPESSENDRVIRREVFGPGGAVQVVSGDWNPARLIIVEFESMAKFNAWFHSPEYKAIAPLRERATKTNAVVVDGV